MGGAERQSGERDRVGDGWIRQRGRGQCEAERGSPGAGTHGGMLPAPAAARAQPLPGWDGGVAAVAAQSLPSWKDPKVYNHTSIPISPYLISQGSWLTSPAPRSR